MSQPRRWVLASGNPGKLAELRSMLREAGLGTQLVAQSELGIIGPPENGAAFVENALAKARYAARASGCAAIADDSGLIVDALGGEPGVLSARYAGPDADDRANVAKLLAALRDTPDSERGARFHCVLVALERADDPAPIIAFLQNLGGRRLVRYRAPQQGSYTRVDEPALAAVYMPAFSGVVVDLQRLFG